MITMSCSFTTDVVNSEEEPTSSGENRGIRCQTTTVIFKPHNNGNDGNGQSSFVTRKLLIYLGVFVVIVLLAILLSLSIHLYHNSESNQGSGWFYRYNGDSFGGSSGDVEKMQSKLLSKVTGLWELVNQSVHDNDAREYLRNLSRVERDTCYSAVCVHTSLHILESMDWKIDPCEDFYKFSCGGWIVKNPPEHPDSTTDHFAKINERVVVATQRIIHSNDTEAEEENKGLRLARLFYKECIDIEKLESQGLSPIKSLLAKHGGWPILMNPPSAFWDSSKFNWIAVVALLQRLSSPAILSLEIKQDNTNSNANAIFIVEPLFFVNKEYLVNSNRNVRLITSYKKYVLDVALEFIRDNDKNFEISEELLDRVSRMANDIVEFEVKLAKLVSSEEGKNLKSFNTVEQLSIESKDGGDKRSKNMIINWKLYFDLVFKGSKVVVGDVEKVFVHDIDYLRRLSRLVRVSKVETLANYLIWRIVVKFMTGATKSLRETHAKFYLEVYGESKILERNVTCSMVVNSNFGIAMGTEFVKYYNAEGGAVKKEVEMFTIGIRDSMEELLGNQAFVPHLLKLAINRKLGGIKVCVGFPDLLTNLTYVKEFYKDLDEDGVLGREGDQKISYVMKNFMVSEWLFVKGLGKLREGFDNGCWGGDYWGFVGEAYAYYDTGRNSINLPIGLLQSPFYYHQSSIVPGYLNYGGLGTIIGHEFTHSLNIEGWVKSKLAVELEALVDCLVAYYSETDVTELVGDGAEAEGKKSRGIDGYRTRSENLADHFGVAAAFYSYKRFNSEFFKKRGGRELDEVYDKYLPGLRGFNDYQMFFVNFANMWCDSQSKESLYDEVESSTHTPSKYRVLGALRNSKDFAEVWGCKVGSGMNPKRKCSLF